MEESALSRQIRSASDDELVPMLLAGNGELGTAAIQTEATKRLIVSLHASARAANRSANVLIALTIILVVLTVVLIVRG